MPSFGRSNLTTSQVSQPKKEMKNLLLHPADIDKTHRRRIYTEGKAKVVVDFWGQMAAC